MQTLCGRFIALWPGPVVLFQMRSATRAWCRRKFIGPVAAERREFAVERTLSLIIASVYLLLTAFSENSLNEVLPGLLIVGGALLFPLACIWFPDELGEYVGRLPGPAISHTSPAWTVRVGGWVLLLLPAVLFWFIYRS